MIASGPTRRIASEARRAHASGAADGAAAVRLYLALAAVADVVVAQECLEAAWRISPVKAASPLDPLLLTHDLACVLGEVVTTARCYPDEATLCVTEPRCDGSRAAIAFTSQLAIEAEQDPATMRVLEQALIKTLDPAGTQVTHDDSTASRALDVPSTGERIYG